MYINKERLANTRFEVFNLAEKKLMSMFYSAVLGYKSNCGDNMDFSYIGVTNDKYIDAFLPDGIFDKKLIFNMDSLESFINYISDNEIEIELDQCTKAVVRKNHVIINNKVFNLSIIDKLAAAKQEVTK